MSAPPVALPPAARRLVAAWAVWSLGSGFILPIVLIYLHRARHIPLGEVGLLLAIPGVVGLAAIPLAGALADRVGARAVACGLGVLLICSMLLLAWAHDAVTAAPALVLDGLAFGPGFSVFNTLLGQLAPGHDVAQRAFAVNFTVMNALLGVGTLVAGFVVREQHPGTFQALFVANAALGVVYVVMLRALPLPAHLTAAAEDRPRGEAPRSDAPTGGFREVLAVPALRRLVLISLLLALCGYAALDSGMPAYANVVAKVSPRIIALALTVNTAVIVAAQLGVLTLLGGRRRSRTLAGAALVWGVSWIIFGLSAAPDPGIWRSVIVLGFAGLFGVGETLFAPTLAPLVNALAPEGLAGRANALSSGSITLAFVVSPAVSAGLIAAGLGAVWIGVLAALSVLAAAVAWRLSRALPTGVDRGEAAEAPDAGSEAHAAAALGTVGA